MLRVLAIIIVCVAFTACSSNNEQAMRDYYTRPVTLPDGTLVRAETMSHQLDMSRGMMFRESAPEDSGMLFFHGKPGRYSYWMYQVKVPLDIIWMTANGQVVEMVENVPPCKQPQDKCAGYGGTQEASVVLELAGGSARKHGVGIGQTIRF